MLDPAEVSLAQPGVIAAIDIGTNSIHMVVARVSGSGRFEILTREKDMVRLGSDSDGGRRLTDAAMDRGVAALTRCRSIAEQLDATIRAVATAAVRNADNGAEFIRRAALEAGVAVEVVSGYEEARLIHLGVLQALPVFDERLVLCDIGGGSTELLVGEGDDVLLASSTGVGAVLVSERFLGETWTTRSVRDARRFVRDVMRAPVRRVRPLEPRRLVGTSGTIESVVAMATAEIAPRPRSSNGLSVTAAQVRAVVDRLVDAGSVEAVRGLPGVDARRADIFLGGALILDTVMAEVGLDTLVFSEGALREGILFDELLRHTGGGARHHLWDIRRRGVLHLMELCEEDPDHAFHVAKLAEVLFDEFAPRLGCDSEDRELLVAAALLANVGLFISHSRHHQHSYYVIRNAESLVGFTDRELEVIAQVARYHRRSAPSTRHEAFAALSEADRSRVRTLAGLLRVAVGLDRGRVQAVASVSAEWVPADERTGDPGTATAKSGMATAKPETAIAKSGEADAADGRPSGTRVRIVATPSGGADVSLDVWSAQQRTAVLSDLLGVPIEILAGD